MNENGGNKIQTFQNKVVVLENFRNHAQDELSVRSLK